MNKISKKLTITLLFLSLTLGLIWEFFPLSTAENRLKNIPLDGISFSGMELSLTKNEKLSLSNATATKRLYTFSGQRFTLSLTDGSKNRNAVHDPTYCYIGAGWKVQDDFILKLENGEARKLKFTRDIETTELVYWFSDGEKSYHSLFNYWSYTTLRRLTLGKSGEEPILVLIKPLDKNLNWDLVIKKFIPLLGI